MTRPQSIAAFDLDGTLLAGQSQSILVSHLFKHRILPVRTALAVALWFIKYRMGLPVEHKRIRMRVLESLRGQAVESIENIIQNVFVESIRPRLRPAGIEEVSRLESCGVRTVIVSASVEPLVRRVAKAIGASGIVATEFEHSDNVLTGRIKGQIVEGHAKVQAVKHWADARFTDWVLVAAYGDHESDIPLLSAAVNAFVVCPDFRLRAEADSRGWKRLDWVNSCNDASL